MTGDDLYQVDKMIMSVGGKCFIWEVGETVTSGLRPDGYKKIRDRRIRTEVLR